MVDLQKIKDRITCVQYCKQHGIPGIDRAGARCVSPLRPGARNASSFQVWDDSWKDWGGDMWGDVIDLCAIHRCNGDRGEAIRYLAGITCVEDDGAGSNWVQYTQEMCNMAAHYHASLPDDYRDYMHKRGITDDTIDRLRIGMVTDGNLRGRLFVPYYKNGYVAYYITRSMPSSEHEDTKYMKAKIDEYNDHCPWGLHTLDRDPNREVAIVAEGAFDIMSFDQESAAGKNWACLSAITGSFSSSQLKGVLQILRSYKTTYIIYDNDGGVGRTAPGGAGEKFTDKMARILFENRIPFRVAHCPVGYKDVSEFYADGGDLQDLLDNSDDGIIALVKKLTAKQKPELAAMMHSGCRYRTKSEIEDLFREISKLSIWDDGYLRVLKQECSAAPSEDYIANEVLKHHKLLCNGKIGVKEYDGVRWVDIQKERLHLYIGEELGVYTNGARLSTIERVVRSRCETDMIFNTKPVINFVNGTLELKPTIRFREHSADDMCTYCMPYPYRPDATCAEWENFIHTVFDGDKSKETLLQETAGYVLQDSNKLEAAIFLIGEGSNGKSIFTKTLGNIFCECATAIPIETLDESFRLVQLSESMVNVSGETSGEMDKATSNFKAAVSGDALQACYKGKDFITFKPRTKFFINCNNYPRTSDTSNGFLRKCEFIAFPLKFMKSTDGVPTRPNERVADITLEAKLQKPEALSGIFNWILEGYQRLESNMGFTQSAESEAIKEQYKEVLNPMICWIKDEQDAKTLPEKFSLSDIFERYRIWCEDSGHKALAKNNFKTKFEQVIKEYAPEYEHYRTGSSRDNWRRTVQWKEVQEEIPEMWK